MEETHKKQSRSDRYRKSIHALKQDVAAMEGLIEQLMKLLDQTTALQMNEQQRQHYRAIWSNISVNLSDDDENEPKQHVAAPAIAA